MKKVGSLLIALMLLLNVSFGYTLTITYDGDVTTREVETNREVKFGLADRSDADYVVDSNNAILQVYENRRQFVMPAANVDISITVNGGAGGTVQIYTVEYNANGGEGTTASSTHTYGTGSALTTNGFTRTGYEFNGWNTATDGSGTSYTDAQSVLNLTETANGTVTLYAQWSPTVLAMSVEDYVEYHPTATPCDLTAITGITQDALNPSATTQWRVLSNNGTTVELVSADMAGTLTLGSTSDAEICKANYAEIGRILREISEAYVDESVATGGRGLGFKAGSSVEEIDTTTYPITWENTYTNGNNGFPYTDEYYSDDVDALTSNNMLQSSEYVWLASRSLEAYSNYSDFYINVLAYSGNVFYLSYLMREASNGDVTLCRDPLAGFTGTVSAPEFGVRPVVSLKSGISVIGAGMEDSPLVIN